jgi:uroporphyrinogen-III synthase
VTRPRVLIVRSGLNPFARVSADAGVEVVEKSSHSIDPVTPAPGAFAEPADLAIFTSQVAVERVAADASLRLEFEESLRNGRVAAVGSATAEALSAHGIEPSLVAAGSAESLLDLLPKRLDGERIVLPCGEDAAAELPEGLRLRGAHVDRVVVYRKVLRPFDPELDASVREAPFSAFCVTSPSAATWLFGGLSDASAELLRRTPAVVLGRFTRRFLERHGVERIEIAPEPRLASAVRALEELATVPRGG